MAEVDLDALRRLQGLIGRLNAGPDLAATLRAVVDGVVEGLGFSVAVVSLVRDDEQVEVVTVAGPQDVSDTLLSSRSPLSSWEKAFGRSEVWGLLRYEPHDVADQDDIPTWVPDTPVLDSPDAWHPLDALYAPLFSVNGALVGILSVDLPHDGRRPGAMQRELLEMYAVQAGIAVDNAQLAERLRASEESFRLAFENAPFGMSLVDFAPATAGRLLRVNETMCQMLGRSRAELESMTITDITHPDDAAADGELVRAVLAGETEQYQFEKRYRRADGGLVWVSLRTSVVRDSTGTALYGITQFEDVSDRRAEHQELSRRARMDPLTGLLNRAELAGRVERAGVLARDTGRPGALLFGDLDGFKPVNDTHGHSVGDQVLAVVARRLESQLRSRDALVRFGGDEFVVVVDDVGEAQLQELVDRLREVVAAPIDVGGLAVSLTMTIGTVAVTGAPQETPETLVAAADLEMYLRKPGHASERVARGSR